MSRFLLDITKDTLENTKSDKSRTLYDACMKYKGFGDADFDEIDFDNEFFRQKPDLSELENLFDD